MPLPIDKRGRSVSRGGSGGRFTALLSALLGKGGQADPNVRVNPDEAPEFEGGYVTPAGQMVDQPFSSRGYNFWDRLFRRPDQANLLNNEVALKAILSSNEGQQILANQRGLNRLALEQVEPMGEATTRAEVGRRRALIPVTEEEATSKSLSELADIERKTTAKARESAYATRAAQGIMPEDVGGLSTMTARNLLAGGENQLARAGILNRVLNAPANAPLFEAATLAEAAAPIGAVRNAFETGVPAGSRLYRDAIGNPTLDALINPGVYTGNIISQEPAAHIPININGQTVMMPFGEKSSMVRQGGFIPAFDPIRAKAALDALERTKSPAPAFPAITTPAPSGIKTDPSVEFPVKPRTPALEPVKPEANNRGIGDEFLNNLIGERGTQGFIKLLHLLLGTPQR